MYAMYTSTDPWLLYKVCACGEMHSQTFCYGVSLIARDRLQKKFGVGRNRNESSMSDISSALKVPIIVGVGVKL